MTALRLAITAFLVALAAPAANAQNSELCQYVAAAVNEGSLADVVMRGAPREPLSQRYGRVSYDIDGDSVSEYVFIGPSDGVDTWSQLRIANQDLTPFEVTFDEGDDWASEALQAELGLVAHGNGLYVVGVLSGVPRFAVELRRDRRLRVVCELEQAAAEPRSAENAGRPLTFVMTRYDALLRRAQWASVEPWQYALRRPGLEDFQLLLDSGYDVDRAPGGQPLLIEAMTARRFDVAELLLRRGADANAAGEGRFAHASALELAVSGGGNPAVVELLLDHGARPDTDALGAAFEQDMLPVIRRWADAHADQALLEQLRSYAAFRGAR